MDREGDRRLSPDRGMGLGSAGAMPRRPGCSEQGVLEGDPGHFDHVVALQFSEEMAAVGVDRQPADAEFLGDLSAGVAMGEIAQDLDFPCRQVLVFRQGVWTRLITVSASSLN